VKIELREPGNIGQIIAVTAIGIGVPPTALLDMSEIIDFRHGLAISTHLAINTVVAGPVEEYPDAYRYVQGSERATVFRRSRAINHIQTTCRQ
jgi:hypothetical protein